MAFRPTPRKFSPPSRAGNKGLRTKIAALANKKKGRGGGGGNPGREQQERKGLPSLSLHDYYTVLLWLLISCFIRRRIQWRRGAESEKFYLPIKNASYCFPRRNIGEKCSHLERWIGKQTFLLLMYPRDFEKKLESLFFIIKNSPFSGAISAIETYGKFELTFLQRESDN